MRTWKPIAAKKLKAIIADTEADNPVCDYCAADVYRLAREVEKNRQTVKAFVEAMVFVGQWLREGEEKPTISKGHVEKLRSTLHNLLGGE